MAVIREVYDSDNSEDMFRMELERALQVFSYFDKTCYHLHTPNGIFFILLKVGCRTIVIEPNGLALETRRWITTGEYIKAVSVATGCATFLAGTENHEGATRTA